MSILTGISTQKYNSDETIRIRCSCGISTNSSFEETTYSKTKVVQITQTLDCGCSFVKMNNINNPVNREQRRHPKKPIVPPNMLWTKINSRYSRI